MQSEILVVDDSSDDEKVDQALNLNFKPGY